MLVNRIARHLDAPPAPPTDTRGRYEFVSDAVLRAVAAVTRLLDDDDPAVVLKAAKMILDVEKTRMRHGREVHGAPDPESVERREMLGPLPSKAIPMRAEFDDDFDDDEQEDTDFDDEPAIRPIPYRMGHAPTPPPPVIAEPPDTATDNEPSEFRQWLRGFYAERFPGVSATTTTREHLPAMAKSQEESGGT